jgi:hypothetical protein
MPKFITTETYRRRLDQRPQFWIGPTLGSREDTNREEQARVSGTRSPLVVDRQVFHLRQRVSPAAPSTDFRKPRFGWTAPPKWRVWWCCFTRMRIGITAHGRSQSTPAWDIGCGVGWVGVVRPSSAYTKFCLAPASIYEIQSYSVRFKLFLAWS